MSSDPYRILDVSATASPEEVRAAYRRAVKRHHPDLNGGSPESARRFEAVQEAYAEILARHPPPDDLDSRLAALEAEIRSRPRPSPQPPRAAPSPRAPSASPEEKGVYSTDDTLSDILDDAVAELGRRARSWLDRL